MNYQMEIKSIIGADTITVGPSGQDLVLMDLRIDYNYLSFSSPGTVTVVGFRDSTVNPEDLQSGALIFIYENSQIIYLGYLSQVVQNKTARGIQVKLGFNTLLYRFSTQKMVNIEGETSFTLSPFLPVSLLPGVLNRIQFQLLIDFMMTGTLYEYLINNYGFGTPSSKFKVVYEAPSYLSDTTDVLYVPSPGATKEGALRNILYPYQIIVYQSPSGDLRFSVPSYSNKTDLNVEYGDVNVTDIQLIDNEAEVLNNVMVSLIQNGFLPQPDTPSAPNNVVALSTPNAKYFPHLTQLIASGYFYLTEMEFRPLPSNATNDPAMSNALTILEQNPSFSVTTRLPSNAETSRTVATLFSSRMEGEALARARNVVVTLVRTADYTDIPIGKVFSAENKEWICIKATLSLLVHGNEVYNTITITGAPLSTCTGAWIS